MIVHGKLTTLDAKERKELANKVSKEIGQLEKIAGHRRTMQEHLRLTRLWEVRKCLARPPYVVRNDRLIEVLDN